MTDLRHLLDYIDRATASLTPQPQAASPAEQPSTDLRQQLTEAQQRYNSAAEQSGDPEHIVLRVRIEQLRQQINKTERENKAVLTEGRRISDRKKSEPQHSDDTRSKKVQKLKQLDPELEMNYLALATDGEIDQMLSDRTEKNKLDEAAIDSFQMPFRVDDQAHGVVDRIGKSVCECASSSTAEMIAQALNKHYAEGRQQ